MGNRPDIEQLIFTLKGGKASYIPLVELGIHPTIKAKFLGRPVNTLQDDVQFWQSAGYDYIKLQPTVDFHIPGHQADESISASINWAPEGDGIIGTWMDFDRFHFTKPEEINFSVFENVKPLLPDGMGVIGQYGDIFTMVWELMGFTGFSYNLFDNPDLVEALFNKIGTTVLSIFEYLAQSDIVDILWYSDDIAYIFGLMLSPEQLRKYFFPWLEKIGQLAKDSNKPLIYHSDGLLLDVMTDIIECGVDALHPIEPKAMDIIEVKKQFGDHLCLIGNLDVGDVLSLGSTDDVRILLEKNFKHVGYNGGYCAGSGNSIPDYINYDNYLAMLDVVHNYSYSVEC